MTKKVTNSNQSGTHKLNTETLKETENVVGYDAPLPLVSPDGVPANTTPVLIVDGKEIELTLVKIEDIDTPRGLLHKLKSRYSYDLHIRNPEHKVPTTPVSEFYHAKVETTDVYLSTGSKLKIKTSDKNIYWGGSYSNKASVLFIIDSDVTTDYLDVSGYNFIDDSTIVIEQNLILTDTTISKSKINQVKYATIRNGYLQEADLWRICHLELNRFNIGKTTINGGDSCYLTDGGLNDSKLFLSTGFSLTITDKYINDLNHNNCSPYFIPTLVSERCDFEDGFGDKTITITKRLDYGHFNAKESLPFVRVGKHNILVNGVSFTAREFFPGQFINIETLESKPELKMWDHPQYQSFPRAPGEYSKNSVSWKKAYSLVMGNTKGMVSKTEESIISGLLDQIRSRISIFIESAGMV